MGERRETTAAGGGSGEPGRPSTELTTRAVVAGMAIASLVAATNLYFGLRVGFTVGGSLLAAILGHATFAALRPARPYGPLENNITQTAASAGGGVAAASGLTTAIPALGLLGIELDVGELYLWALAISFLGVFFAIPLRRQLLLWEGLRFPSGTATAETILALQAQPGVASAKARALLRAALLAAAFSGLAFFIPEVIKPPMAWFGLGALGAYSLGLYLSPMLLGAGMLIGPRIGVSLLLGALVAWGVLAPLVEGLGWVAGRTMSFSDGARGWILWPGVALIVAESLMELVLAVWAVWRPRTGGLPVLPDTDAPRDQLIPRRWVWTGLAGASALTVVVAWWGFAIPPLLGGLAILLAAILSVIATRAVGETDINPLGGVGKVTQLVYGGVAPGQLETNLLTAGLSLAGAQQAGDMMNDLKTGQLLGASPRRQVFAQLLGVGAGVVCCVPIYLLFDAAYDLGSAQLPAPSAHSWKAMAELLASGPDALPDHADQAVVVAALLGGLGPVLRRHPALAPWVPSGLAAGIAFIVPAYFGIAMFLGSSALAIWRRRRPTAAELLAYPVASGLIAGEGLFGVVSAVMTLLGVTPLTGG